MGINFCVILRQFIEEVFLEHPEFSLNRLFGEGHHDLRALLRHEETGLAADMPGADFDDTLADFFLAGKNLAAVDDIFAVDAGNGRDPGSRTDGDDDGIRREGFNRGGSGLFIQDNLDAGLRDLEPQIIEQIAQIFFIRGNRGENQLTAELFAFFPDGDLMPSARQ